MSAEYTKTVLPNGVRVVTERLSHVRSVSVGVWLDLGSRDERPEENGMCHFIEHMVFKGTKKRSIKQIAGSLESVGGYLNAFTAKEHTCYYARVLDQHAGLAFDVLSDLILNPVFPAAELEKERAVVLEELRNLEDDPDDLIQDYLELNVFPGNSLGQTIIGTEQSLTTFTRERVQAFHKKCYSADRIVVAAAGNIAHDEAVRYVKKYFGQLRPASYPVMREKPGTFVPLTKIVPKPIQQAHACIGTQIFGVQHPMRYPLMALNTLLGEGMSSRLFQNIREKHGLTYNLFSFATLMTDAGIFGVYLGAEKQKIQKALNLVFDEFDRLMQKPIPAAELRRTKEQMKGSMMLGLESAPNRMMRLGNSELYYRQTRPIDTIIDEIESISREQVLEAARMVMKRDGFVHIQLIPNGKHRTEDGPTGE